MAGSCLRTSGAMSELTDPTLSYELDVRRSIWTFCLLQRI